MNIIKYFANQLQWIPEQLLTSELFNIPDTYNKIELRRLRTGNLLGYYLAPDTSIHFDIYPTIRSETFIDVLTRYNIPFSSNDRFLDNILTTTDYIQFNFTGLIEAGHNINLSIPVSTDFEIVIEYEQLDYTEKDGILMWQKAIDFFYNENGIAKDVLLEENIVSMGIKYSVNYNSEAQEWSGLLTANELYFYGYATPAAGAAVDKSKTVRHTVRYISETETWEAVAEESINFLSNTAPQIGEYIYQPQTNIFPPEVNYLYKENTASGVDFKYSMNFFVIQELTPVAEPFLLIPTEPNLEPGEE